MSIKILNRKVESSTKKKFLRIKPKRVIRAVDKSNTNEMKPITKPAPKEEYDRGIMSFQCRSAFFSGK